MDPIKEYLESLTETERIALEIARNHLGTSFDISKSIGFLRFNMAFNLGG